MKVLKFGATWCGPCQVMEKRLEKFTACDLVKIDVDEDEEMAEKWGVTNIPVIVLVDDNDTELKRWVGLIQVSEIENEIKKHIL